MAKRTRWQPPYPDPAKQARADSHAARVSEALEDALAVTVQCIVSGCRGTADLPAAKRGVSLCEDHARVIAKAYEPKLICLDCESRKAAEEERQAARTQSAGQAGTIYYVQIADEIKVGWTSNLHQRMASYPPSAKLLATEPGSKTAERSRHHQFNEYLAHGREWFESGKFLLEHIDRLVEKYGDPPTIETLSTPERASLPSTIGATRTSHRRHQHDGSAAVKRTA